MSHWIILPVLLPMFAAALVIFVGRHNAGVSALISLVATVLLLVLTVSLMADTVLGGYRIYSLGTWPAPFGIILVLDRLSALMMVLTAVLATASLVYTMGRNYTATPTFNILFQFQLMGLNGAFLTGDLFNLFVFFEILLVASYGLLMQGEGPHRTRAALHYVILNLVGSTVFLIALGMLYGVTGTLNMADMAELVPRLPPEDQPVLASGALLLLLVFALKAALLPLYFWLPSAYSAAIAPVAALFAIMTKVGAYSILRVFTLIFGAEAGSLAHLATSWLLPVALLTIVLGSVGALASDSLRRLVAYLVVISVGTLLVAFALANAASIAAGLYYLVHSTLLTGALFLLVDVIASQRGARADLLETAASVPASWLLGSLYFLAAVAIAGMPPLSGFLGKVMILEAGFRVSYGPWILGVILVTSLFAIVALSRAGSQIFWKTSGASLGAPSPDPAQLGAVAALCASAPLLAAFAGPMHDYATKTAEQLTNPEGYVEHVLGAQRRGFQAP
jgi:multicomponent K+:H+ antiporter subunit D